MLAVFALIFPQSSGFGEGNDWEEEEKSGTLRKREGSTASSLGSVFSTGSHGLSFPFLSFSDTFS